MTFILLKRIALVAANTFGIHNNRRRYESVYKVSFSRGLMIAMATEAKAVTTALGKPIEAVGSNVQAVPSCGSGACYNTGSGAIGFYIPLNSADNGTYGIDIPGPAGEAGTFSDSKSGAFTNSNALTMYLRFTPLAPFPLASAVLTFSFVDLDLIGVNDPERFSFFQPRTRPSRP